MAKFTKEIAKLEKSLTKVDRELREIARIIATTDETSNLFWGQLKKRASKTYEEARVLFRKWNLEDIPETYKKTIQGQIRRIKNIEFKPKVDVKLRKFLNKDLTKQTISTILEDSLSSFYSGTQMGEKKLNRLIGSTQQLNITEKKINQLVQKGFVEGAEGVTNFKKKVGRGSVYGVQRSLQNELLKDSLDGKTITIIDKNGNPRNYNIKSYSNLVARTKLIETQSSATVNLSMEYGSGLVQVSSHNTLTPYDAQFEGKVFDLTGKNSRFPTATDLPPFHPNCQHTLTVFFEEALNEEQLKDISDFSKGKIEQHPTMPGHKPVSKRNLDKKTSIKKSDKKKIKQDPKIKKKVNVPEDSFKPNDVINQNKELSKLEKITLGDYKQEGFKAINEYLYAGKVSSIYSENTLKAMIKRMDDSFLKSNLNKNITLYRGIKSKNINELLKNKIGSTLKFNSFQSTSTNKNVAELFMGKNKSNSILLKINAKKELNVINMEPRETKNNEREILLKRDTEYKIKNISKDDKGRIIMEVDII